MFRKSNSMGDSVSFEKNDDQIELRDISDTNNIKEEATETEATETETEEGSSSNRTPSSDRSLRKMDGSSSVIEYNSSDHDRNGTKEQDRPFENYGGISLTSPDSDDRHTKSSKKVAKRKTMVRESAFVIDLSHHDQKRKSNRPPRFAGIDYSGEINDKIEARRASESTFENDTYIQPMSSISSLPSRTGINSTSEFSLEIDYGLSDKQPVFRRSTIKTKCQVDSKDELDDDIESVTEWEESLPNDQSLTSARRGTENRYTSFTSNDSSIIGGEFSDLSSDQKKRTSEFAKIHTGLTNHSNGRRSTFANAGKSEINQEFRVSKKGTKMTFERAEAYCYNHGMEIALGVLFLALNVLMAGHGAYQFSSFSGWTTDNDVLRVTLPIARAGGRLVTLNCSILLLTACKYLWTLVRTYVTPVVPIGFPVDEVMPKYHRYVALTIIFMGCIVHTLPQIVNYASQSITMDWNEPIRIWTFGKGFATKQLLITGVLLTLIFTTFFLTTLSRFRRTTAGFRWFWTFHMVGIAMAYPLLIFHGTCFGHPVFLYAALAPLLLYLFDISMRRRNIFSTNILRWRLHKDDGQEITELALELPKGFSYTPGQYAEIKFTPISGREWHPFTIASAPNEEGDIEDGSEKKEIVFFIKNCGKWTGALADYASAFELAKARNPPQMFIRGPHGAPAMNYIEYKHIIVIGSGVGVTPLLSIWKYLVDKGTSFVESVPDLDRKNLIGNPTATSLVNQSLNIFSSAFLKSKVSDMDLSSSIGLFEELSFSLNFGSLSDNTSESLRSTGTKVIGKHRLRCIKLAKLMESMIVSLSLFIWFVLGGTVTILFQLVHLYVTASAVGSFLLLVGFLVHICIMIIWAIAVGPKIYFRLLKCWLDFTIIVVDFFAVWHFTDVFLTAIQDDTLTIENGHSFAFFGAVTTLQAIRLFHLFYITLKAPTSPTSGSKKKKNKKDQSKRRSCLVVNDKVEFCSVRGILINRKYSMMKFAARTLLPPILESGLMDVFAMDFYGTREKKKDTDDGEHTLVGRMMGSKGEHIDVGGAKFFNGRGENNSSKFFCPGRPDWNLIFHKAISEAHVTNEEGESVGVFFCGSPAIAKDLVVEARRVTAQHQFAMKHLHGKRCNCKLIIHSENF